jgi:hypothetical protein
MKKIKYIKDYIVFFRYGRWVTRRVAIGGIAVVWLLAGLISFVPISLDLHRNDNQSKYNDGEVTRIHVN